MLAPPLGSWRPLLGEILDPPLSATTELVGNITMTAFPRALLSTFEVLIVVLKCCVTFSWYSSGKGSFKIGQKHSLHLYIYVSVLLKSVVVKYDDTLWFYSQNTVVRENRSKLPGTYQQETKPNFFYSNFAESGFSE